MATLRISLLGGFEARLGSGRTLVLKGRKTQALLAYLALAPGRRRTRDELSALLWSDRGEAQARSSLRQSLSELRKSLGEAGEVLLVAERDLVALDADAVDVDVSEFERSIDDGAPAALERAAALFRGDLLDGIAVPDAAFEAWLRDARGRLGERACEALSKLLEHQAATDSERAIATARRLLALDPLREATHRALMRLHAEAGERALALKQYQACRDLLTAELGVAPEPETDALAREIREGVVRKGAVPEPAAARSVSTADAAALPDKPAVAVLPFANLSGDPEQNYFSDGLTEDVITELGRFSSLEVVARNSTFVYRDKALDASQIGERLGARYLLEGSVRRTSDRIRLTAQLIDARSGKNVWAERYDSELDGIFAVQDELVHTIVATLAVRLTAADTKRALRKPAQSTAAYDLYLRALSLDRHYDLHCARQARDLAAQSVALDPGFARAHAMLASQILTCGWFEGPPGEHHTEEALPLAAKAAELDPDDSFCTSTLALVHLVNREYELARHYFEMALKSNPHDTWVLSDYAWYLMAVGEPDAALENLDSKETLEPHPPNWHWEIRGQVLYMLERYEEAKAVLERMPVKPFWVKGFLAACCGQLDRREAAKRYWQEAQEASPGMGPDFANAMTCYRNRADADRWIEGLRKAGLAP